jgi:4'-phosphopantetheinyl transferase EntD
MAMPADRPTLVTAVDAIRDALEDLTTEIGVAGVTVGVAEIDPAAIEHLHPEEYASVERAVERRRAEFATGRSLLRSLLPTDQPIPVGPAGRPVVPGGHPVSLAHDDDLAVAVAVRGADGCDLTVGVDLEHVAPFPAELGPVVLRPDEQGVDPCLAFCAKEAAYKAWSAAGGRFLEHHDLRLTVDGRRLNAHVLPEGFEIAGAWTTAADRLVALAWMLR